MAPSNQSPPSSAKQPAQFQPNPELLAGLGESVELGGYKVQPPKGYTLRRQEIPPPGSRMLAWVGNPRPDGSSPSIQVIIIVAPPNESLPTIDEFLNKSLASIRQRRSDWKASEASYGLINGIQVAKSSWTGKELATGQSMAGIMYVCVTKNAVIQLSTQDLEQYSDALNLGEAALLTFSTSK